MFFKCFFNVLSLIIVIILVYFQKAVSLFHLTLIEFHFSSSRGWYMDFSIPVAHMENRIFYPLKASAVNDDIVTSIFNSLILSLIVVSFITTSIAVYTTQNRSVPLQSFCSTFMAVVGVFFRQGTDTRQRSALFVLFGVATFILTTVYCGLLLAKVSFC